MYLIRSTVNPNDYWSNEYGWASIDEADYFTNEEQQRLPTPMEGAWVQLWDVDVVQFARLIAEMRAANLFGNDDDIQYLAENMSLEEEELLALIDRACACWQDSERRVRAARS